MRYTLKLKSYLLIGVICFMMVLGSSFAWAELKEGTVINAANIDKMKPQEFEGKTIASMLPEKIEWWIRNHGLNITLRHSEPLLVNPRWVEETNKYSGDVKFDPKTRDVTGYKAGLAFPNIKNDDPNKASKLLWNMYLTAGYPKQDYFYIPFFRYQLIDAKKGLESEMEWVFLRVFNRGALSGLYKIDEKDPVDFKQICMALEPYDIRGIGTFFKRYKDGRTDDTWAYLRSVRRTRRLSGGTWMDPIGGTDQLNDEIEISSAYPAWYKGFKYLGKRYVLAIAHSREPAYNKADNSFPNIDLKNPPYWNPVDTWEPREVHVFEVILPEEHSLSKRVIYLDAQIPIGYYSEAYDKKGDFVKIYLLSYYSVLGLDSPTSWSVRAQSGFVIDFKRMHATVWHEAESTRCNPPGMGLDDVSLSTMEAIAQGKYKSPNFKAPGKGKPVYLKDFNLDWETLNLK